LFRVSDVTQILDRVQQEDPKAGEELLPLVYDELRKPAVAKMAAQPAGQTLQATALVHEAWLRMERGQKMSWSAVVILIEKTMPPEVHLALRFLC